MITPFMGLDLPIPTVTLGPEWASDLNAALESVDSHDHTSGKGKQITPAAININTALSFNANSAEDVTYLNLENNSSTLTNPYKVYTVNGDLYWNNGSAVPVQITSGGSVVSVPASVQAFDYLAIVADLIIGSGDATVFVSADTAVPITVTLPLASSVTAGRIYVVEDGTSNSEANTLTITLSGADTFQDGSTSVTITSNGGSLMFIGNGANGYKIF